MGAFLDKKSLGHVADSIASMKAQCNSVGNSVPGYEQCSANSEMLVEQCSRCQGTHYEIEQYKDSTPRALLEAHEQSANDETDYAKAWKPHSKMLEEHHKMHGSNCCTALDVVSFKDNGIRHAERHHEMADDSGYFMPGKSLCDVHGDDNTDHCEVLRAVCVLDHPTQGSFDPGRNMHLYETHNLIHVHDPDEVPVDFPTNDNPVPAVRPLVVPNGFNAKSFGWDDTGDQSNQSTEQWMEQQSNLQKIVKPFARAMLQGVRLALRLDDGGDLEADAFLDPELSQLTLRCGGGQRELALKEVRWVRPAGADPEKLKCVLLRFSGGRFVCFRFNLQSQGAYFGTCMRVISKAAVARAARIV